jgi:tRNA(Arg) A34 adenosine deaminase TadA
MSLLLHKDCHNTEYHVAQLFLRNKLVAEARNAIGTRSRGCGYQDTTIHAEFAVIKRLGNVQHLKGCTLVVVRINRRNEVMGSKPCACCTKFLQKCIGRYGLRKVVYS